MQLAVAYWPDTAEGYFERLAPGFALFPQQGDSLSARLDSIFNLAFSTGWERVMAIDGDTPTLPPGFLSAGFEALDDPGVDVVLGPTEDGGYYAIGMRKPHPTLFDVIMSTPHVLKDTLARAQEVRLKTALLPGWHDVDEADDLYRLATDISLPMCMPQQPVGLYARSNWREEKRMLKTIFETGPKTSLKWIALLRIMLGVLFLTQWYYNLMKGVYTPDGLRGSLEYFFMNSEMPLTWYKAFINQAIIPIVGIFAPFQMIAELLIGIALLFGVLTPLVSLGAGFFILNTFCRVGAQIGPGAISSYWASVVCCSLLALGRLLVSMPIWCNVSVRKSSRYGDFLTPRH